MPTGIYVIICVALAFIAIPAVSALPEPFSLLTLFAVTVIYPFLTVWLLQEEARRNQQ